MKSAALHGAILVAGIAAPFAFPAHTTQVAILWIFILFALTWDVMGGQMGYNSLGNILFFGLGMYVSAIAQIGMFYDVAEYTAAFGAIKVDFTSRQYFAGLALGLALAALAATAVAAMLSWVLFGLRVP
jgi:branched-chain amino acid transport system permease protein